MEPNSLKAFCHDTASVQPGSLQEVLLHEATVAGIRRREATMRPVQTWKQTYEEFGSRVKRICQHVNDACDVEALCRALPSRVQALRDAEGDRISK